MRESRLGSQRGRAGGVEVLKAHTLKGMTARLTAEQKGQIPDLLAKGAEVIARTFGVRYHRDHVGRLLREAGWSRQKPMERASQRNDEARKQMAR